MFVLILTVLIFLGLCLGSFVNALVWRLKKQSDKKAKKDQYSIAKGRSMCSHCKHPLAPSDLVPFFSWVWLRGKCRYCKHRIEDTPVPEIVLPVLFVSSYLVWPFAVGVFSSIWVVAAFAVWLGVLTCFMALSLYDAKWFLLPDRVVLPLSVLSVLYVTCLTLATSDPSVAVWSLLAAATIAGLFWTIELVSRGAWIGHGDVKLAVSLGLLVGTPLLALLVMFIASVLGTAYTLPRVMADRKKAKALLPFGPFLMMATVIVVWWGESILGWYFSLTAL